mmetsp:Transcript_29483/g.39217  ORF Transcript_29483/g.39217 Transcript_29483/m.39217 type:complete len:125 (-) Transcript_29483:292-666(-)
MSTSARKIAKDMSKTIDSEDEDGIVQHREKSRATRVREETASMKDSIKLSNINVPKHIDTKPTKVTAQSSSGLAAASAIAVKDEEKDLRLEEALADKQKLLGLLSRVKKTFDGFKRRHTDLVTS